MGFHVSLGECRVQGLGRGLWVPTLEVHSFNMQKGFGGWMDLQVSWVKGVGCRGWKGRGNLVGFLEIMKPCSLDPCFH